MLINKYGTPDEFYAGEIDTPTIKSDEILVKVAGSSVNPIDTVLRQGMLKTFIRLKLPVVLGVDASGVVVEVGASVTRFKQGDKVYAFMGVYRNGGYGEYVAIPEAYAAKTPDNLDLVEAGVVPGVGMTAFEAFTVHAPITKGMHVLVNGATGGVGTYAVQIAKYFGAEVTAVCSTEKIGIAQRLGADTIVDYKKQDVFASAKRYDIILNCVRGISFGKLKRLLKPGGTSIVIAGSPAEAPFIALSNLFSSKKTVTFMVKTDGALLEGLNRLIEQGAVQPIIEKMYSWRELAEAHRHAERGNNVGKIGVAIG